MDDMYESSEVVGIVFTEWAGSRCGCEIDPFASPNSLRDMGVRSRPNGAVFVAGLNFQLVD